jgi:NAD(P)-dependent dehydrogenase (short-subunit alcohol dehydrogenase family)
MRTALVTGGGRGIGRAIADRLAADGHRVVITYVSDAPEAPYEAHRLDVRDSRACDELAARVQAEILVNNGAIVKDAFVRFLDDASWRDLLDVDLTGGFRLARAFVPGMAGWGRVIHLGSYVGRAGAAGRAGYAAAKAGLLGLTTSMARELAPSGITVNCVCPGLVWTERTRGYRPEVLERALAEIPLQRAGEPSEVAGLVSFLASEDAGYMTGQALSVDGGLFMREFVH